MPTVVEMCGGGLTVTRNVDAGPLRAAVAVAHGVVGAAKGLTGSGAGQTPVED
jgi:hypothetical protein